MMGTNKWYTVFLGLLLILILWDMKLQGWVSHYWYSFKTSHITYPTMQHHIPGRLESSTTLL